VTCQELVNFLSDYLDGKLPAEMKAHFEAHLGKCPPCVAYLKTYNSGAALAKAAFEGDCCEVPEDLVQAILAARKS
jgi:anti-sigma factor RsiW